MQGHADATRAAGRRTQRGLQPGLQAAHGLHAVQGVRQSLAYFANSRESTNLQGPEKRYPPVTFPRVLTRLMTPCSKRPV